METRWAREDENQELENLAEAAACDEQSDDPFGDMEEKTGWTAVLSTDDTRRRELMNMTEGILTVGAKAQEQGKNIVLGYAQEQVWVKFED